MALVLILYWPALRHPYRLDDFAWLCLRNTVTAGRSLWWALFSPQAQGTIRPLGERLWFLLASSLFGLNPVPLHLLALCTQVANVLLMADTGWRLTGSRHAAAIAAILWVINDALVDPIVWASAFNEVLYTFWLLLAFNAFLRGISSRRPVWLVVQLLAYLLALGTLELAVMFPAIAAAYVILFERSRWKDVLPSAVLSAAFIAIHLWAVPLPQGGPYKLTLGWGVLGNLLHRWATVLGPEEYGRIHPINFSGTNLPGMNFPANFVLTRLATVAMSTAILLWAAVSARVGRWIPVFCLAWFVIPLAPTLPLADRSVLYYAFLPSIGLAWLAGDAIVRAATWQGRSVALACAALYAVCQIPSALFVRDWDRDRSLNMAAREARLSESVREIRRRQPDGPVFLSGLDWEQFRWGLCYGELAREGFTDLHVLPDADAHGMLIPPKEWCSTPDFQLSREETARLLREGRARVYDVSASPPVEIRP